MLPTDPARNLEALIRCRSVTPVDGGAQKALATMLERLGFRTEHVTFGDKGTPDVDNMYARLGNTVPHLMFAGHTDVVPPGDESAWTVPPFSAETRGGMLYGRGAVDMKGGIACFVAAIARLIERDGPPAGSVSLLITGDEEGPSINGTDKLLGWAAGKGEKWDAAIVGEPTNPEKVGDAIKIGRRGSISGRIVVKGKQGHSAYPHLADNPVNAMMDLLAALLTPPIDEGSDGFQATGLEITSVDVANPTVNVIPRNAAAQFNIRFNDLWDGDSIKTEIMRRLAIGAAGGQFRRGRRKPVEYELEWVGRVSPVFMTHEPDLIETFAAAVMRVTGSCPELSTGGGTSDARFVKDYCPVIEFGLVGQTMHQVDERVALADLETLTRIYEAFLESWFKLR